MAEKGDMGGDTVSLPPTYAPSETFTESPPPAYRKDKSSRVQIVKLVCVTVVVSAVIIGFFIVTSNYLNVRHCNCNKEEHNHKNLHAASFFELPQAGALVGLQDNSLDGNNNFEVEKDPLSQGKQLKAEQQEQETDGNTLDLGDVMTFTQPEEPQIVAEIPIEEVEAIVQQVAEEEQELEQEVLQMEEEEEQEVQDALQDVLRAQVEHMKKIKLPIDLILGNPALAGRDVNCEVERREQPLGGGIVTQAIIVTCHDDDDGPELPQERPSGPMFIPPPGARRVSPPLSLLAPIMKMLSSRNAPKPINFQGPRPMPFSGPIPNGPFPCPANSPFPCIINVPRNMPGPMNGFLSGPINIPQQGPIRVRGEGRSLNHNLPPFPFMGGPKHFMNQNNQLGPLNGPMSPEPVPFRPLIRKSSPRMPRLLMAPERRELPVSMPKFLMSPDRMNGPIPMGMNGPMPMVSLHRGALPLIPPPQSKVMPRIMPEAKPRALDDPVNLPSMPSIRIVPGRLIAPGPNFLRGGPRDEPRPMTHMEMRAPPPLPKMDFGPPRGHTVIKPAMPKFPSQVLTSPRFPPHLLSPPKLQDEPQPQPEPLSHDIMTPQQPIAIIPHKAPIAGNFPPPPPPLPPKMDPEGRTGIVKEIEPEAEMIKPQGPPTVPPQQGPPQQGPPQQGPPQPINFPEDRKHHLLIVS